MYSTHETSLFYLARRQLLQPDEFGRLQRDKSAQARQSLELNRLGSPHNPSLRSWELAGIAAILGEEFLTTDEHARARLYLLRLRHDLQGGESA
jgi:hypothetical protein